MGSLNLFISITNVGYQILHPCNVLCSKSQKFFIALDLYKLLRWHHFCRDLSYWQSKLMNHIYIQPWVEGLQGHKQPFFTLGSMLWPLVLVVLRPPCLLMVLISLTTAISDSSLPSSTGFSFPCVLVASYL